MKKFLWGFIVFFVILIGTTLVGPRLISWNNYKNVIISEIKNLTGKQLKINGDIKVSLLPIPTILLNKTSVSNPQNFASNQILIVKSTEIKLSINHLIRGQLKAQQVNLIEPTISLEALWNKGDASSAKKNNKGIWGGSFIEPYIWRKNN